MRVLVTGANGFIAKNLIQSLSEKGDIEIVLFTRKDHPSQLIPLLKEVDFVFHLAGINHAENVIEFNIGNMELTQSLVDALVYGGRTIPVIYTSSIQAKQDNPYGLSKRGAEDALLLAQRVYGVPVHLFRLPNIFGKWCKPNYNSVVATFCHNIANRIPIQINDPSANLTLVHIDNVVKQFIEIMDGKEGSLDADGYQIIFPQYSITVGELADQIKAFRESRLTLKTERVGAGFTRALYSTYLSYLPSEDFLYSVPAYSDARGVFVEMLKTPDCGQLSYFTLFPGVTRGGHYHHTKTEKFLVVKGQARFRFRNILTNEAYELMTSNIKADIVETVPGWTHDITNMGKDELIVMLWANEIFDRQQPDTYVKLL